MVLESIVGPFLGAMLGFVLVMSAAYAGALRALDVFYDREQDSIFLSEDAGPRGPR